MSISTSGSNTAGEMYSLLCEVSVAVGTPNITWLYSNGTEVMNGNGITLSLTSDTTYKLTFNPLEYSDVGVYTCIANITVDVDTVDTDIFEGSGSNSDTVSVRSK